ncbi:MAG: OsmC family protein [Acidobacteria bacterium]|nr:OsmC family protein [Acidobacteriota bacterium]
MKELPHQYDTELTGGPSGHAEVRAAGLPPLRMAEPVQYDGPGDAWSPEELLLASVQGCFLFTLRAVSRLSKVPFTHLEVRAAGTVDRQEGATRFTEIVLRPSLTVPAGTDRARVLAMLEKAKKACLVSSSLSTPIRLEPQIQEPHYSAAREESRI